MDEYASLAASFIKSTDHSLRCNSKLQAKDQTQLKALKDHQKKECARITNFEYKCKPFNIAYNACPCNFQHPLFNHYMNIANHIDKGHLPSVGGFLDQPSKIMEAVEYINHFKALHQEDLSRQQSKNASQNKKK